MIRQSEFAEKFIVRFVAQLLECREVRRTVSEASGAVNHRVDTMQNRVEALQNRLNKNVLELCGTVLERERDQSGEDRWGGCSKQMVRQLETHGRRIGCWSVEVRK